MRTNRWPLLGLALAAALAVGASTPKKPAPVLFGEGPAYKALGELPVMHAGRIKPIDTLAREEIKQIVGRESIKFYDDDGDLLVSWQPVAALFDWPVHPEYWNKRPFIKVEYLPLKRLLLSEEFKEELGTIAAQPALTSADREAVARVAKLDEVGLDDLRNLLRTGTLPKDDAIAIDRMARKLGEGNKFFSPDDLQEARVRVDGQVLPFLEWVEAIDERGREISRKTGSEAKLAEVEQKALDAGHSLARYRNYRDRGMTRLQVFVSPRPSSPAYVAFSRETMEKVQKARQAMQSPGSTRPELTDLELEAAATLNEFYEKHPGRDADSDENFSRWLHEGSSWVPQAVFLKTPASELEKAGFPKAKVEAFQAAYRTLDDAERSKAGLIDEAPALAFLASARELGLAVDASSYPADSDMTREVAFNNFAPFFKAPWAYGAGTILLLLSLSVQSYRSKTVAAIHKALYATGMVAFVSGIGLEAYGFSQRVLITGWAPVTNMYETVIWVGLVTAVIGLILEAIYRKTYAAVAGSGVATITTLLAATVPLLDPTIHQLTPVLRSNLWLSIHVLTIVSSYAAFALAMGLGMIATIYYLTATYRRSAGFGELLALLIPGLPILGVGILVREASYGVIDLGPLVVNYGFWPSVILSSIGGVLSLASLVAVVGEVVNRSIHAKTLIEAGTPVAAFTPRKAVDARELVEVGGPFPPISGGSPISGEDPRTLAMRETAAKIKPLSNFIYRAMQVGVLLVAAGTILGGVWADYSWGRFWGWDAKEVWALITLLVYLVPLHGRFAGWVNTFGLVIASVVCFLSVLMAWYGVNFVLGVGLHAYGFVQGGSQGTVGLCTLAVLAIPAGAAWRRHLSQTQHVPAMA